MKQKQQVQLTNYKTTMNIHDGTPGRKLKSGGKSKGAKFGKKKSPLHGLNLQYGLSPKMFEFALQMSIYKYMLEKTKGIEIIKMEVVHIDVEAIDVHMIELPYIHECVTLLT